MKQTLLFLLAMSLSLAQVSGYMALQNRDGQWVALDCVNQSVVLWDESLSKLEMATMSSAQMSGIKSNWSFESLNNMYLLSELSSSQLVASGNADIYGNILPQLKPKNQLYSMSGKYFSDRILTVKSLPDSISGMAIIVLTKNASINQVVEAKSVVEIRGKQTIQLKPGFHLKAGSNVRIRVR